MGNKQELDRQVFNLGFEDVLAGIPVQAARVRPRIEKLAREGFTRRLWQKDGGLWNDDPAVQKQIGERLGWLDVADRMEGRTDELTGFVEEVKSAGFTHVVHMGMGGSSLAPLAFQHLFQGKSEGLPVEILDTTDPFTIAALTREAPLSDTLFIVASKSGTTAEPNAFDDYFFSKVKEVKGERAGENFVAVTDPDTLLAKTARERRFRRIFLNFRDIGGRFSALSYFGLLPAALMGLDLKKILERALLMERACGPDVSDSENPGVVLGAVIGEMVRSGRDKLTFLLSSQLATLGMWLEQLIAESTGKEGTGVLPVTGEPVGNPLVYGNDRLFVYMYLKGEVDEEVESGVRLLQGANLPVVRIEMKNHYDIGQEFYRWEIATAVAGSILGINPFDQPDVQASKDVTNRLLSDVSERGSLSEPEPVITEGPLRFFYREGGRNPEEVLWNFLSQGHAGNYLSFQLYLPEDTAALERLQAMRIRLRNELRLATTIGFGPRFLHSTGQYHKGGPNTGLFIQFTASDLEDVALPGRSYTFGTLKKAQAFGDFEALLERGRRVMRIDLGADAQEGMIHFQSVLERALALPGRT